MAAVNRDDRVLRIRQAMAVTGLGRTCLYSLVKEGRFPAPIKLTHYSVGWLDSEVRAWLADRVDASRKAAA